MIDHSSQRTIKPTCSPNSTPARFQNIPAALTPFIGREQQVQEVSTLLQRPEVRLLTMHHLPASKDLSQVAAPAGSVKKMLLSCRVL